MQQFSDAGTLKKLARSKSFGLAGDLKNHILAHRGEKLHKCMSCNKSCGRAGDLRDHMLTRTGEKRHFCTDSNKSFRKARSLRTHLSPHADASVRNATV